MNGKAWVDELVDAEMIAVRVRVRPADVVYIKSVLEASEGLGAIFAEPKNPAEPSDGGALVIAAPRSREAELRRTLSDLRGELSESRDSGVAMWDEASTCEAAGLALEEPIL